MEITIVPRPYQVRAVRLAVKALQKKRRALVVLATALGKTLTSAFVIQEMKPHRVLFLVHNNFILDNAVREYRKVFDESHRFAIYNGRSKEGAQEAEFVFASFQTMSLHLSEWEPDHFDLVVVDESHHSHAKTYRPVIGHFTCPRLGITATPDRMDLLDIREMFGKEVINISLEEAIARNWLPRIEYHLVTDDSFDEEALKRIAQEVLEEGQRISLDELNRRIFIRARDEKVADIIHGYNEKTIVFCRNITHADNFSKFLRLSAVFHSKNGRGQKDAWKRNQAVLEELRNGTLLRVLAINAFNEGVDVPAIGLVVFCRVTDSETIFRQQLGRGMRPGKDKLVVLDFVGNVERILMLKRIIDRIISIHKKKRRRSRKGGRHDGLHLSGRGFEFTFSDKLVELFKVVERIQDEFYPTWEEAAVASRKMGIKGKVDYRQRYKNDPKLPSSPSSQYSDFPGWPILS